MKKTNLIAIATSLALLSSAANFAVAKDRDDHPSNRDDHHCRGDGKHMCVSAPEIDPAQAMGALALLGGTIAIVRGYRRRRK